MALINKKAVKAFVLGRWKDLRPGHEMTRVGNDVLVAAEANLRNSLEKLIRQHPSVGKTIKPD